MKNELAGGVMPSKYFGANAAWLRLAVLSHNVLTALKRIALPAELLLKQLARMGHRRPAVLLSEQHQCLFSTT
ncbi:MAG: hypothetical protein ACYCOR_19885 [Acidobacteriaceae bacterium]